MTFRTFLSKASFIAMFVVIGAASFLWFSQRQTETPEVKKVYKATTPSQTPAFTGHATSEHSHTESHTHPEERPSDHYIRLMKERVRENPSPKSQRYLAFLESKEGRAFIDNLSTFEELYEMKKRFGYYQESPLDAAIIDGKYREHHPTGSVDENEPIIRDLIAEAILDTELHKEENLDVYHKMDVVLNLISEDQLSSWLFKKFGTDSIQMSKWFLPVFEEVFDCRRDSRATAIDRRYKTYPAS